MCFHIIWGVVSVVDDVCDGHVAELQHRAQSKHLRLTTLVSNERAASFLTQWDNMFAGRVCSEQ